MDVQQGELGDCWLLSAIAGLTLLRESFEKVVPTDQGFHDEDNYVGAFRFHFWQYGAWIEVGMNIVCLLGRVKKSQRGSESSKDFK